MKQMEQLKQYLYSNSDDIRRTAQIAMGIAMAKHHLDRVARKALVDKMSNVLLIEPSLIHAAAEKHISYLKAIVNNSYSKDTAVVASGVIGTIGHYADDEVSMLCNNNDAFSAGYAYVSARC